MGLVILAGLARSADAQTVTLPSNAQAPPITAPSMVPATGQPSSLEAAAPGRRIRFFPRGTIGLSAQSFPSPDGQEQITIIESGVVVRIDGVGSDGPVELATDRLVIWSSPLDQLNLSGSSLQKRDAPLEFYMEGNIVFRQAEQVIYARSMYYNVPAANGIVLEAEMLTPVEQYEGLLRVKADVLRQIDPQRLVAHGAAVTTSRLGVPQFWFQTETATLQDLHQPLLDPLTGLVPTNPATGTIMTEREILASSRSNLIYLRGVPVFYWPVLKTDLTKPSFYLEQISIKNDSVFGTQILTEWDMFQLLGILDPPPGTEWTTSVDYLSERGFALGTNVQYDHDQMFGLVGPVSGEWDLWGIDEHGLDDLGRDRRAVPPAKEFRGRVFARHRQRTLSGLQLTGEVGLISDRNFLEEYYESEWDELKDQITGVELKKILGNTSWNASADARVNDFFAQTQWLPRLDHFQFAQSILPNYVTWLEHTHIAFADLGTAVLSTDPKDPSLPLDWETDSSGVQYSSRDGVRTATRQEIDLPLALGPVKVVPYGLGEVAFWGQDRDGNDVTRLFGQAGVRASLPLWWADPTLDNPLLDLRGLAHKVVFETDLFWADADEDFLELPLYDPLDDDSEEAFRRRFFIPGGPFFGVPAATANKFEERLYAHRYGLQRWVTAPTEIADDLAVVQLAVDQRWQTKRGLPGQERIVDWISLDLGATLFPNAQRDNFGADVGLIDYDMRWHLGDRVTFLSDGYFDVFGSGLRTVSVGGFLTRPGKISAYLGFRSIEGPISASVVSSSLSYRLSPKWISTSGSSIDFGDTGNIGQSYEITRIGESFLTSFSVNYDRGRDNVSVGLAIEPRFLATSRRGRIGGLAIPPVGMIGLE
jgi:hypothetical protein